MIRGVSVVVLCWNRWDLTSRCLASIKRFSDLSKVEVIAVDNGSTDGTPDRLEEIPWIRTARLDSNLGCVRGYNHGMSLAAPENDILLVNTDIEILEDGWVERLQQSAHSSPDIGVVGCRQLNADRSLSCTGAFVVPDTCRGHFMGVWEMDVGQCTRDRDVPMVIFSCAYIRREVLSAVGFLSEAFVTYFEDTDLCFRAREAGFRTICCGGVSILHEVGGSIKGQEAVANAVFDRSWQTFQGIWQKRLLSRYRYQLCWRASSRLSARLGFAERSLLRALDMRGVRVVYSEQPLSDDSSLPPQPVEIFDPYHAAMAARKASAPAIAVHFGGAIGTEDSFSYNIGYAPLSAGEPPADWDLTTAGYDEFWVPTEIDRQSLCRRGLGRPVHVVPLGIDADYFHPAAKTIRHQRDVYSFLSVFEGPGAADAENLIRLFNRTFDWSENVILICAFFGHPLDSGSLSDLPVGSLGGQARVLDIRLIPHYQLPALYSAVDCYVSLGGDETWDVPALEAMACGLPVIAPGSGLAWCLGDGGGFPFQACPAAHNAAGQRPSPGSRRTSQMWDDVARLLRHVFVHPEDARQRGAAVSRTILSSLTIEHVADRIEGRLDQIARTLGL
jgi:GT2 family glycosyltransferase